ncbi:MAG: tetratricopeptide repeat protein [Betaproteobacteria bacterium]
MNASALSPELQALATAALAHQNSSRFAEAAQAYAALLSRAPELWPACYNLALVYQHLQRLPEAAEMYARAVALNPRLAAGYNNLGNVLKSLNNDGAAIEAYRQALSLDPHLAEASHNLAMMLQAGGQHAAAIEAFRQAVTNNPANSDAWDALYRGLLGLSRQEEAIQAFLDWERATEPSPERVVAGLALCRPMGDRDREAHYLSLALGWPFAVFTPEQFAPVLGMIQYFDVRREELLACYRRYDEAVSARHPVAVPMLPRRAADARLRVGYVSGDFRQHVVGRMMLDVIGRHDRDRFSILLVSTCARNQHDAVTAEFRKHSDGFADVSELDDFAAAKSIAEADIDVLVDLSGHTDSARPGIYAHRPARSLITHLGYHGCLGLGAIDFKLTDRLADLDDASAYQLERPYVLDGCVFPVVRVVPSATVSAMDVGLNLSAKFVFGAFLNVLKLSPRCLDVWRRILDELPQAILLFSPLDPNERFAIERVTAAAGIDASRVVILDPARRDDASLRARYRLVHAVMDTFPYAGGDTTLAALDMGVPVVTLAGARHSERIGASILGHIGLDELVAGTADEYVAIATRLARDAEFMAATRRKIALATVAAASRADRYTRSLESAFLAIAALKPSAGEMKLTARQFFQALHDAMRRQQAATDDTERQAIAAIFAELRAEQPDYPPLLRAQGELAQIRKDPQLAADCLAALVRQFPDDIDARLSLAGFLIDQRAPEEALRIIDDAAIPAGTNVRVLKLQIRAHMQLSQWELARGYGDKAVELAPADAQVLFWQGLVLSHLGEVDEALNLLNRTLILAPDHAEAAYNAGVILAELGNHADAEKVFRRALGTSAARAAHARLLQSLKVARGWAAWLIEAQRFAGIYARQEYSRLLESRIARYRGDLTAEAEILLPLAERATLLEDHAAAVELISELLAILPCHDVSPRLLQRLHARLVNALRVVQAPSAAIQPRTVALPAGVRCGYLVDFSLPFMAELVAVLAAHTDRLRLAMTVYVLSPADSAPRERLEAAGIRVHYLAALDERRIAETIRSNLEDVLIDASAFGVYSKPGVLSHRPAPLQIALPGLDKPAGIGELDYRLSDNVLDLGVEAESLPPAPWFVAGSALPVISALTGAAIPVTRAAIAAGDVPVFGILAAVERLSVRNIGLWKSLADRVPEAVFLIAPPDADDALPIQNILVAAGIDAARMRSLPALHPASYSRSRDLALAAAVDVILDTVPASDYVSARQSLLEGIPIVTMPGRMPDERVAFALLSQLGETATVAASGRDYVDIATRLAASRVERLAWQARVRARWQGGSAADMPFSMQQFTRRHEDAVLRAVAEGARLPTGKTGQS